MKYFTNCRTIEEVKAAFRDYAKKLHPDCGGSSEEFRHMMDDYQIVFNRYKDIHKAADGTTYEKQTDETAKEFASVINAVIHMDGVIIEIIGSWVWLEGNTFPYREQIKEAGFWFSKSKKAWYHNGEKERSRRKGHYSMEKIKEKFGCETVETIMQGKLA